MKHRMVITGIGLTAPNGNNLNEYREALLNNRSGITHIDVRHMGKVPAGICNFEETRYQTKKARARGTRAGAIAIYCANEAIKDSGFPLQPFDKSRIGIYLGITEHGTSETEHEIYELYEANKKDTSLWNHNHNPRSVANAPAGEVSLNLKITGPHYTIGAACAAGNMGVIQACQMLELGEVDMALAGGVSECASSFIYFASFAAQKALATNEDPTLASRPLDKSRNGIVISEGGCIYTVERLEDALKRHAKIYGEIVGYHCNSDALDFVLPNADRQVECMQKALRKASLEPKDIDLVNMHATGTPSGDIVECDAVRKLFETSQNTVINCTKGFIGHTMGAAGALELAGNLPGFDDGFVHPCKGISTLDEKCQLPNIVLANRLRKDTNIILSNSFGMLGINSTIIVRKYGRN